MIPYAVFMMKFIWKDTSLEVRAIDMTAEGVSFRLSKSRKSKPDKICIHYLQYDRKSYEKIEIENFEITETENEEFYKVCFLKSSNQEFVQAINSVMRTYGNYVYTKLENDELSVMEKLTGQRISENICRSLKAWHEGLDKSAILPYKLKKTEIAVDLDLPRLWNAFLKMNLGEFFDFYWRENGLTGHEITKYEITHIYIGNQFCPLLFPNEETLFKILKRIDIYGLTPVIVFSTMPEHMIEIYRKRLGWLDFNGWQNIEIVINDLGITEISGKFKYTLGVLYCKRKKDTRYKITNNNRTLTDSKEFRNYVYEKHGISSFSYEVTGYDIDVTGTDNILHLPMYQMNTSGFCTMYAMCKNGNRELQEENLTCPYYCNNKQVFYPDNLQIIGRFNSIFGCSMIELNDSNKLNGLIDKGIKRLVLRV